jgi:hypothetical protein
VLRVSADHAVRKLCSRRWAKICQSRMIGADSSDNTRQLLLCFGLMSLLLNMANVGFLLDFQTSYLLKNIFHASPSQISLFRLLTGIPLYLGFAFGMVRDLWNPLSVIEDTFISLFRS